MSTKKDTEKKDTTENISKEVQELYNPLLNALKDNDKKNLFKTNITTAFIKTGFPQFDYYFGAVSNVHDEEGNIMRQEPRVGQAAGTFNLFVGSSGTGKALPVNSCIPTPTGMRILKDIKVGDYVFNDVGNPVKVIGVYPQRYKKIYRVTQSGDDRECLASEDHLWEVYFDGDVSKMNEHIVTTLELYEYMRSIPSKCNRDVRLRALRTPVKYNDRPLDMNPYDYGVFLHYAVDVEGVGLTYDENYIYNSVDNRIKLLRGIIDDEHSLCHRESDNLYRLDYTVNGSINGALVNYNKNLVRSLGMDCKCIEDPLKVRCKISVLMSPKMKNMLFPTDFESNYPYNDANIDYYYPKFEDIEPLGSKMECVCISVDDEDKLFLTSNYIVTHNTTLASQIAANIIRQYPYANIIHFDCENRFDMSRAETITKLPSSYFDGSKGPERYMIKGGGVSLEIIQKMIVDIYKFKMQLKDELIVDSGVKDEFGKPVMIFQPTVIIIDSLTTVLNETFSPDNSKDIQGMEKMRSNTEGARDAKTVKGFFKDVIPLCKEANIIIFGINHINNNMSMTIMPVGKSQNYLKQDEIIPGGKSMIYYPFNIAKLIAKPSDDFKEDIDGFNGHIVQVEPIKSSSNQSGNNSKGVVFELIFSFKNGFDPLRSIINYGRQYGIIEGNKNRLKFKDDPSFTFTFKDVYKEKDKYPIWENIKKYVIPHLNNHLSFIEPEDMKFDSASLDY